MGTVSSVLGDGLHGLWDRKYDCPQYPPPTLTYLHTPLTQRDNGPAKVFRNTTPNIIDARPRARTLRGSMVKAYLRYVQEASWGVIVTLAIPLPLPLPLAGL